MLERADIAPPVRSARDAARRGASLALACLDLVVAVGRKAGGFCALLSLGWLYFRILVLGTSLRDLYPNAADPDLRQTLWVVLLLIMAQGWDISSDEIAALWARLPRSRTPRGPGVRARAGSWRRVESVVLHLGRFMDLCVAVANKVGAFAVLVTLLVLAGQVAGGASARALYPDAAEPQTALLADLCVCVLVLGWWATPFSTIAAFWHRWRRGGRETSPADAGRR